MSQLIQGISKSKILSELDTYNYTAELTSMYMISVQLQEVPASGITMTIQQNGSTKASTSAPQAEQSHVELQILLNVTAADVISVILASSSAIDKDPNSFKALLKITPGMI